jgi:cation diffusion facilitator family transporter
MGDTVNRFESKEHAIMSNADSELEEAASLQRRTLWVLLAINAGMFILELVASLLADSAGLLADALDMLADASVYGIALYAAGRSLSRQADAARLSGIFQIAIGLMVLFEAARRFLFGSDPLGPLMILVASIAFVANLTSLVLIHRHKEGGIHMRASWIFSASDVIANIGVAVSGTLVFLLDTPIPDLVIGAIISLIVVRGGFQILREAKESREKVSSNQEST